MVVGFRPTLIVARRCTWLVDNLAGGIRLCVMLLHVGLTEDFPLNKGSYLHFQNYFLDS